MDDWELLQAYARTGSEASFQELVGRYGPLVYSSALRQLGVPELAEEVAQSVFCLLAQKAHGLSKGIILIGWLHRAACYLAADVRRSEQRRRRREQEVAIMETEHQDPNFPGQWDDIAPLLDQAIAQLREQDRQALLLRFFQHKEMREVGRTLAISEDAAKMRVSRALEQVRRWFARRGVVVPGAALSGLLWNNSVQALPIELLRTIATAAAVKTSAVASGVTTLRWLLFMAKVKTSVTVGTLAALLIGTSTYLINRQPVDSTISGRTRSARASANGQRPAPISVQAQSAAPGPDARLEKALAELRAALYDPLESRTIPFERVTKALERFRPNRRLAIPLLLEALHTKDSIVRFLATRGLSDLGSEAAETTPELMKLLETDKLFENLVPLFVAVHPGSDLIPRLIELLGRSDYFMARGEVGRLIPALAETDPVGAAAYRSDLGALLQSENADVRVHAADALAHYPGPKDGQVVPVLIESLKAQVLLDPHFYDPRVEPGTADTYSRDGEKIQDNSARYCAVGALNQLGPLAKEALPQLQLVADHTDQPQLREMALEAIGTIDPQQRLGDGEIGRVLDNKERAAELVDLINTGCATVEDCREGLTLQGSVDQAAKAIRTFDDGTIRRLLPDLRVALESSGDYQVAQIIKEYDPQSLVPALKQAKGAREAAESLRELGTAAQFALPALYEALENGPQDARLSVAAAIESIDKTAKPMFHFQDLNPAVSALMQAADAANQDVRGRIMNVYIEQGLNNQGLNNVTRGQLVKFVRAVQAVDTGLGQLFASRLVESNPSVRQLLKTE